MKNLRLLRESNNISQQKLADTFGLAQTQIHSYENYTYEPDISTLILFAEFFDTSVDYIVGNTDIQQRIESVKQYELNEDEESLLAKYRELPKHLRNSVHLVINSMLAVEQ